jgi:hypothetical protein
MNTKSYGDYLLALLIVTLLAGGCASGPKQTSTPAPTASATATQPAAQPEPKSNLPAAITNTAAPFEGEGWQPMFDGHSLKGWEETTQFGGRGPIECRSGVILLNMGDPFTGINWTNPFPKMNYEIVLDAMRVMGSDFFCGLTVPVGDSFCSLIVGGWGGTLVGISSLDGMDASENETTKFVNFEEGRWYRIRLRVTTKRIEAWIDKDRLVNVDITDKKISLRPGEIEYSKPVGIASYQTMSAFREIRVRRIE